MIAERGGDKLNVALKFAGESNIKSNVDQHMHGASFKFVNDNHVAADWIMYQDGKEAMKAHMEMRRKKG